MIAIRLRGFSKYKTFVNVSSLKAFFSKSVGCRNVPEEEATIGKVNRISFKEKIEKRRTEAKKSVVIQVQSEKSAADLHQHCSQYATIKNFHHYCLPDQTHFFLLEFDTIEAAEHLLKQCCHVNENNVIPSRSPFLWFRSTSAKKKQKTVNDAGVLPLSHTYGTEIPSQTEINNFLQGSKSFSEQILTLYKLTHLNDLGERLRFLTAHQIELALQGPFPLVKALPFGSSVNGFGRMGCDLDLVLQLDNSSISAELDNSRLVFQSKACAPDGRMSSQRLMETVGDMCQLFLPGVTRLKRILQARVPIIKFQQDFTGVECDLSVTNLLGVKMSELLYIMGNFDPRVRPLVFAVRSWAQHVGLTNSVPGQWITNFSLVLLVLYFLQQRSPPVLPNLNKLVALSALGKDDEVIGATQDLLASEEYSNTEPLHILFMEFFTFYTTFDFNTWAINVLNLSQCIKPEHAPLYIVNPLEPTLNVSKNVSHEEKEKFRSEIKTAAWVLQSMDSFEPSNKPNGPWGLLSLFNERTSKLKDQRPYTFQLNRRRKVSINKLFLEENR